VEAARLIRDRHCEDVRLLDVRRISQVCDFILIGTGTSDRQIRSVGHELADFGEERGQRCFSASQDSSVTWMVLDFIDLVVHLFEPSQRAYYDLESLWSDAGIVNWQREGGARNRA